MIARFYGVDVGLCLFDIVKYVRENLIRNTYQFLISEDAELFDRVVIRVD